MSEKKEGFKLPDFSMGMEMFNQIAKPMSEAMQSQLEQVRQLQTNMMNHTQKAMEETYKMSMEGFKQANNTVQKIHETAQEQLKKFTQR